MITKSKITIDKVRAICEARNWWFPAHNAIQINYNCFLFGVRNQNRNQSSDAFDDLIGVIYPFERKLNMELFEATTDPSVTELVKPTFTEAQRNGTAIIAEGQYRGVYQIGHHGVGSWRHRALVQVRPIKIYRDSNRDQTLDLEPERTTEGLYGVNLHMAHPRAVIQRIQGYSAGCQVIQDPADYQRLMYILGMQQVTFAQMQLRGGDRFSYTLMLEQWFD